MDPERGKRVVSRLVVTFLEWHTKHSRYTMDEMLDRLLDSYGLSMLQLLSWNDARVIDQRFYQTGGTLLRSFYGWPNVGSVVSVKGEDFYVTKAGLLTFSASQIGNGTLYDEESSSRDDHTEGDRL